MPRVMSLLTTNLLKELHALASGLAENIIQDSGHHTESSAQYFGYFAENLVADTSAQSLMIVTLLQACQLVQCEPRVRVVHSLSSTRCKHLFQVAF